MFSLSTPMKRRSFVLFLIVYASPYLLQLVLAQEWPYGGETQIAYGANRNYVLSVSGPIANASPIKLSLRSLNTEQRWTLHLDGTVRLANTKYCLNLAYNNVAQAVDLFSCNGHVSQVWDFRADGTIVHRNHNIYGITLTSASPVSGASIKLQKLSGANVKQKWQLIPAIPRKAVITHNAHPGWVVNLNRNNIPDQKVNLWARDGTTAQDWALFPDGSIRLARNKVYCLGAPKLFGAPNLKLFGCHYGAGPLQIWNFLLDGTIALRFYPQYSINLNGNAPYNGNGVNLYPNNRCQSQTWRIA